MAGAVADRYTLGVDVSDLFSNYCLLDEAGAIVEQGRLRTSEHALRQRFSSLGCRVIVEAGTHSPWIGRLFNETGHEVVIANPRRVQLIAQATRKNDRADAETLARLGRLDPQLLAPVTHRSAKAQDDLAAIRGRQALINSRTLLINHMRGAVKSTGARLPACDANSFHLKAAAQLPEPLVAGFKPILIAIESLTDQIRQLDKLVLRLIETTYPEARVLQQVAGVSPLISLAFILTIGDPNRFRRSRDIGPYLGLIPRQRESGDSSPELRITKTGDSFLRQLLVQGAHYILGYRGPDCDLRRWGLQRAAGGKSAKKRAVVGVARRLAVLLHHLWTTGEVYRPLRTGEVTA